MVNRIYQNRIENDIKEIVDKSREIEEIKHKGLRGTFRESTIGQIFKKYLSPDWDIGSGEIIDSMGNTSKETDLIIFNKYNVPPILFSGNSGSFPIETCAYVFEIKTTSNATEIKSTIAKFQSLKSLRSASTIPITVYLAFDTDLKTKTEFERYIENDLNFNNNPSIDVLCVLGQGYWYYKINIDGEGLRTLTWYYQKASGNLELSMLLAGVINTLGQISQKHNSAQFGYYFIDKGKSEIVYHYDAGKNLEIKTTDSDKYNQFLAEASENNFEKSIEYIHEILDDKKQISFILFDIGVSKKQQKQYEATVYYLAKSLEYNDYLEYNIKIFQDRGFAYLELNKNEEAISDFDRAINLNPMKSDLYYCKGIALLKMWDLTNPNILGSAINDCFSKCIELNPRDERALFFRATALWNLGLFSEAKRDYQKILGLNPNNYRVLYHLDLLEYNINLRKGETKKLFECNFQRGNFENFG